MSNADKVYEVLTTVTGVARDEIREDMDLVTDLDIDSPKGLRLLVELEDHLEIEISDDDAAKLDTVGDILRFVEGLG